MIVNATWTELDKGLSGRQIGVLYEFHLDKPPVLFTLSAVRETRGGLQAEIRVDSIAKGEEGHILRDHLTLISTRSKNAFAKTLGDRTKVAIGWAEIVEVIAFATADTFRQGEPFIFLKDAPDLLEERTCLVRWFAPYGHTAVLYGDGMSGKSLLALSMAIVVATGTALPGLTPEKAAMPVVYLDWETTAATHKHYLRAIERAHGLDVPREMLIYRRMTRSLAAEAGRIKEEIDRNGAGFVVVDSMVPACGGEPESAEVVLNFFNALRGLGPLTNQVISHLTKAEAQRKGQPRPFGSVFTTNLARSTWLARRAKIGGGDALKIGLYHTKTNIGPLFGPRGIRYQFGQESEMLLRLSEFSVDDEPELGEHMPLSRRIRGVLGRGAMTVKEIAEEVDANDSSIRSSLRRMKDTVILTPGSRGRGHATTWVLRSDEDVPPENRKTRNDQPDVEQIPF